MSALTDIVGSNDLTLGDRGTDYTDGTGTPPVGNSSIYCNDASTSPSSETDSAYYLNNSLDLYDWMSDESNFLDIGFTGWVRTEADNIAYYPLAAVIWCIRETATWGNWHALFGYANDTASDIRNFYDLSSGGAGNVAQSRATHLHDGTWMFVGYNAGESGANRFVQMSEDGAAFGISTVLKGTILAREALSLTNYPHNPVRGQVRGYFNQLVFWNKNLSDGEIANLYNSGSGRALTESELANDIHAAWADDLSAAAGIRRRYGVLDGVSRGVGRGMHKDDTCGLIRPTLRETIEINSWRV
ncbi:hypothetical protein KAR91_06275 [Candidatus Pacearchaeota archaeon]|nr:hypothetical protein [Candidatus Pacearchaeota archaeon]